MTVIYSTDMGKILIDNHGGIDTIQSKTPTLDTTRERKGQNKTRHKQDQIMALSKQDDKHASAMEKTD